MIVEKSIITYTGRLFWPLNPRVEDVNPIDICHALSHMCRFTGHTIEFYSVAEHSCRVHDILPKEHQLAGIIHDASEAYLMDLASPVKTQYEMNFFKEAEDHLMEIIAKKFGVEYPFDPAIKVADKILVNTEYRDLMMKHELKNSEFNGYQPLPDRIHPWYSAKAKYGMIDRLRKLGVDLNK